MDRKKVFSTLLILIVIVALGAFIVYYYLESTKAYEELHKSRVYEAYLDADDISRKLLSFTCEFYDNLNELPWLLRPENSEYNETKYRIIYGKVTLLRTYVEDAWLDIRRDLNDLKRLTYLDTEIPFLNTSAFETVYSAIHEALGQVGWATLGKGWKEILNETPAFLWELYYVLGVDLVEQEEQKSGMLGLAFCFSELDTYWYSESKYGKGNVPSDWTRPQIALEWAVGNATALHQELTRWDKYHEPLLYG